MTWRKRKKAFFSFFKRSSNKLTAMRAKYDKAEANINKVCESLENHQMQLMKDVALLDKMYELNKVYFKELSMYILAGKKKLKKVQEEDLPALAHLFAWEEAPCRSSPPPPRTTPSPTTPPSTLARWTEAFPAWCWTAPRQTAA